MFFLSHFLRIFFNLLYHQFAWTYDWVAGIVSVGKWNNWVLAVLPYLPEPSVLELGHGPGHLQVALKQRGFQAVGVDASPQMGRITRRRLLRQGLPARLIRARAQSLPLASRSFIQVVTTFPTEYIHDSKTLKEIRRVLKPGGRLVVLPAAWITGQRWMERFAAGLFRITRQAPDLPQSTENSKTVDFPIAQFPLLGLLEEVGFQVSVEWKEQRSSTLILILAEKPDQ